MSKYIKINSLEEAITVDGEIKDLYIRSGSLDLNKYIKVSLSALCRILYDLGNSKMKVVAIILYNMRRTNFIPFNDEQLYKLCCKDASRQTFDKTIKILEANFIKRGDYGYIVNPALLFMGNETKFNEINKSYIQNNTTKIYTRTRKIPNVEDLTTITNFRDYSFDSNWHKLFIPQFSYLIELLGNQKTAVFCKLLKILYTKNAEFSCSQTALSKELNVSTVTIAHTFKYLKNNNFILSDYKTHFFINTEFFSRSFTEHMNKTTRENYAYCRAHLCTKFLTSQIS